LGGSEHTRKKNTEDLVFASKEIGLDVNDGKTKYMVMSQDQNAATNLNIKTGNKTFEMVEQFQYLGTDLTIKILFRKKVRAV